MRVEQGRVDRGERLRAALAARDDLADRRRPAAAALLGEPARTTAGRTSARARPGRGSISSASSPRATQVLRPRSSSAVGARRRRPWWSELEDDHVGEHADRDARRSDDTIQNSVDAPCATALVPAGPAAGWPAAARPTRRPRSAGASPSCSDPTGPAGRESACGVPCGCMLGCIVGCIAPRHAAAAASSGRP